MMKKTYTLHVNYPNSIEDTYSFRCLLGTEYLKLIKDYLNGLDLSISKKRKIIALLSARIKTNEQYII